MWYPDLFRLFGWLIIVTAAALPLLPWRWHYEFGKWAIPLASRRRYVYVNQHCVIELSCRTCDGFQVADLVSFLRKIGHSR